MPRGFAGKSVERFFTNTEEALMRAGDAHSRKPFDGHTTGSVPLPPLPTPINQPAPFAADDAWKGAPHARNAGDSSNVVVEPDAYNTILQRMDVVDYQAGADMYAISNEIEEICSTIFVVPETGPRISGIADQFKKSLNQFRAATEEVIIDTRRFISTASDVDHGNTEELAISRAAADQAIGRVSSSIDRQISSMERTASAYKTRAEQLERQAETERGMAQRNMLFQEGRGL